MNGGAARREQFKVGVFRGYDDSGSTYSRRLTEAHDAVCHALDTLPRGPVVVLDICGGTGRVLIPAVAGHPRRDDVRGTIVDLDDASIGLARVALASSHISSIRALVADAGTSDCYVGLERASLVVVSGVLAHLSAAHRRHLLRFIRQIAAPQALLIWTIGQRLPTGRIRRVRRAVANAGFHTLRTTQAGRTGFGVSLRHEVGVAILNGPIEPLQHGVHIFRFRPDLWQRFPVLRVIGRPVRRTIAMLAGRRAVAR